MNITLNDTESSFLSTTLSRTIGNLKMEIGKTENFEMRNSLKQDEVMLKSILERLQHAKVS